MNRSRAKGKIAVAEWRDIAHRHGQGESFASIARSYGCTPPAIRYIVRRVGLGENAAEGTSDKPDAGMPSVPADTEERESSPRRVNARAPADKDAPAQPTTRTMASAVVKDNPLTPAFCDHVSSDIALFLVALDAAATNLTPDTAHALREATDRLVRAGARTRLALDTVPRPFENGQ